VSPTLTHLLLKANPMEALVPATPGQLKVRDRILRLEEALRDMPGAMLGDSEHCPLTHEFPPGLYVRTIRIPAGTVIVGKLHRHEHPNILQSGTVEVVTEFDGMQQLTGPLFMISKGLTKRALYSVSPVVWTTIHPNPTNTQDLEELEKGIIIEDLTSYKNGVAELTEAPK